MQRQAVCKASKKAKEEKANGEKKARDIKKE